MPVRPIAERAPLEDELKEAELFLINGPLEEDPNAFFSKKNYRVQATISEKGEHSEDVSVVLDTVAGPNLVDVSCLEAR